MKKTKIEIEKLKEEIVERLKPLKPNSELRTPNSEL
ncbi:hypothetical protein SAMN05216234_1532 [Hydrogenimonas thermophila]|uniref:Uncharacterized protein n=1 Tax=Hydrogenimonas thermophila TaxID=223786 RepID=A0A1I5U1D0_9BACT|nr:hypothetical protein SAMN05216234_1532 [Hydrogenimonas thermophila]